MATDRETIKEAVELVAALLPHVGRLRENQADFVRKLHASLEQYGARAFVSEPQMTWLRALAKAHAPDPRQTSFL